MKIPSLKRHAVLWKDKKFILSVVLGIIILIIGLKCSDMARLHLQHTLSGVWEHDLILDHVPVMDLEYFLVWGLEILFGFLALLIFLYPEYLPFSLKTIGLLYAVRSFFIILTPLGARPDQVLSPNNHLLYELTYGTNEFFFSGHTAFPLMLACIFWRKPFVRSILLLSSILFGIAVLVAHTHYSIDVFAVPLIVPTLFLASKGIFGKDVQYIVRFQKKKSAHSASPLSLEL